MILAYPRTCSPASQGRTLQIIECLHLLNLSPKKSAIAINKSACIYWMTATSADSYLGTPPSPSRPPHHKNTYSIPFASIPLWLLYLPWDRTPFYYSLTSPTLRNRSSAGLLRELQQLTGFEFIYLFLHFHNHLPFVGDGLEPQKVWGWWPRCSLASGLRWSVCWDLHAPTSV